MRGALSALSLLPMLAMLTASHASHALVWPDVPERIEHGLASPDPASRRTAARAIEDLSAARATPLVLKALADDDVEVRLLAVQSAVRLKIAPATDVAIQWLGERETRLRIAACEVARAMPHPRAVPALARALGDSDAQVRAFAADALGAQGSPEAVAPLAGKLDDPTPNVRTQVARALAKLHDPRAVVPLVGKVQDSVPDVRQAVVRALGDLGDGRATQALLLALRDNAVEVRVEALAAVGRLRAPEAAPALAPLAIDRNPAVRQAALVALGRIATPAAVEALIGALGTHDDATAALDRSPARDALVGTGSAATNELVALLGRPVSPPVATSAAWVLGELHATGSAPTIVAALRKGMLGPAAALHALSGAGTPAEVPVVLEFVADANPAIREEALRASRALLDPSRPDGRAVEPLVATLKNPQLSAEERAAVATLLGRTGAPRAASELSGLVLAKSTTLRLAAIDALGALGFASSSSSAKDGGLAITAIDDALVPMLTDPDAAIRLHAAVALASGGGPKARRALLALLDGGEEVDPYAVLAALGGILERHPDDTAAMRLFRELGVAAGPARDAVLEAAGRARVPSVVRALGEAKNTGDIDDRRIIASILGGHHGSRQARDVARSLLADGDAAVRAQAAFALGALDDLSALPMLMALARGGDADIATNAVAAVARIAAGTASAGKPAAAAVASAVCLVLDDRRAAVRANALVALAAVSARCGDGRAERKLLADDPNDLVRAAAARVIAKAAIANGTTTTATASASAPSEDRAALDRCFSTDRSAEVSHLCRAHQANAQRSSLGKPATAPTTPGTRAVTIFVIGEKDSAPKPHAPFLVEYEGGLLRAGIADRRGATFDPAAPAGEVTLRRAQLR